MTEIQNLATSVGELANSIGASADADDRAANLTRVYDALKLTRVSGDLLGAAARAAKASGCTWQEIGDAAGVTRQAAFQRFGRPADPRTGEPMNRNAIPHADAMALDLLDTIRAGNWTGATNRFDETMAGEVNAERLADVWAQVIATSGEVESVGDVSVEVQGLYTVVDVPFQQEAGNGLLRVAYDADGKISRLWLLDPAKL